MKNSQLIIILAILLMLLSAFAMTSTSADTILFFMGVIAFVVCVYPIVSDRNYFVFQPMTFVFASVVMGCTFKAFYIILNQNFNDIVDGKLLLDLGVESIIYGAMALNVALACFVFGYSLLKAPAPRSSTAVYAWSIPRVNALSFLILLVSFASLIGFVLIMGISISGIDDLSVKRFRDEDGTVAVSRTGSLAYGFYRLALLAKIPFYLLVVVKLRYGFSWFSMSGIMLVLSGFLSVFIPFFMNNRAGILLPVFDVLMIMYLIRGQLNWRFLFTVGSSALFLVVLGGLFRAGGDLERVYDMLFGGRYLIDITKTAHIITHYSDTSERYFGMTFFNWIYAINPFVEATNPEQINLGRYLGFVVFGYLQSGVPPGIIAELYMNFGWAGLTLGMLIIGIVLKMIHNYSMRRISHPETIIIYTIVCIRLSIFLFNNSFSVALLKTFLDVIAFIIVFKFIQARKLRRIRKVAGS